jgi:CheY-like chemotaxis protein
LIRNEILLNLLGNAIKFTEQGQVTFKIESLLKNSPNSQKENHPSYPKPQKKFIYTIRFQIIDTGIGIAQDKLTEIFLPFHQVGYSLMKSQGTGLGLAISQKLVRLMGSELQVNSTSGQGSRFWFELNLPRGLINDKIEVNIPTMIGYRGHKRKVLVVDDNTFNRQILTIPLKTLGFEISEAVNGREGLDKANKFQPDLILLDVVMPDINGFEMVCQIRKLPAFKEMIVIAISASAFPETQQQMLVAGCNDFLAKPIPLTNA